MGSLAAAARPLAELISLRSFLPLCASALGSRGLATAAGQGAPGSSGAARDQQDPRDHPSVDTKFRCPFCTPQVDRPPPPAAAAGRCRLQAAHGLHLPLRPAGRPLTWCGLPPSIRSDVSRRPPRVPRTTARRAAAASRATAASALCSRVAAAHRAVHSAAVQRPAARRPGLAPGVCRQGACACAARLPQAAHCCLLL